SIGLLPITHPFVIIPLVPSRTDNGGCTRRQFSYNSKRVTFLQLFSIGSTDMVFVYGAELHFKNDTFPNPCTIPSREYGVAVRIPTVKISYHRYRLCIGCPHGKVNPLPAINKYSL